MKSPCFSCVDRFANKNEVMKCERCELRISYWWLLHDPEWRSYSIWNDDYSCGEAARQLFETDDESDDFY